MYIVKRTNKEKLWFDCIWWRSDTEIKKYSNILVWVKNILQSIIIIIIKKKKRKNKLKRRKINSMNISACSHFTAWVKKKKEKSKLYKTSASSLISKVLLFFRRVFSCFMIDKQSLHQYFLTVTLFLTSFTQRASFQLVQGGASLLGWIIQYVFGLKLLPTSTAKGF